MAQPVVHFEVIGKDPAQLRRFYSDLFGWSFDTPSPVAPEVSSPESYGFIDLMTAVGHFTDPEGNLIGVAGAA